MRSVANPSSPAQFGPNLLPPPCLEYSLLRSLLGNLWDALFPKRLPPLRLTSRPVQVREVWGDYNYRKKGTYGSLLVHAAALTALIAVTLAGRHAVQTVKPKPHLSCSLSCCIGSLPEPLVSACFRAWLRPRRLTWQSQEAIKESGS